VVNRPARKPPERRESVPRRDRLSRIAAMFAALFELRQIAVFISYVFGGAVSVLPPSLLSTTPRERLDQCLADARLSSLFPRPRGQLVERGPFALVRHPIYGGVLLGLFGVSLISRPLALLTTFASVVFLTLKTRHEERLLREAVAGYGEYCERVRRRFAPFVL